ncbi:hypothetical protein CTEN210_16271 [Chaetoceros tenuissimus]|uniref:F-box domain-containing protein n=1 Tax=Chaetoceros tenuissimus TaxID=426638 RepID=A0AAD3HDN3_9STRA|nr:hypothetical protein CTEN210_16271 [Chaetoceros tenuissimus]
MSSSSRDQMAVNKKRGRRDISSSGTSCHASHEALSSIDINQRAKELSNKLLSLDKEFPEVKYIASSESLLESAVKTHRDAMQAKEKEVTKEAKKRKAQSIPNGREESMSLFSLPDEVLQNCLSYVGRGYYGLVALASKKLYKAYKIKFGNETAFLEMATTVKIANYCINELCRMRKEKDEMLRAAAVNGNLDILRYAVRSGLDLFPLVEMKKETLYENEYDWGYSHYDEDKHGHLEVLVLEAIAIDVYFTDEDEKQTNWSGKTVKLSKLVERGHLHVLQFLHAEFQTGLQRYCKPAIQHGQLQILEWLNNMGYMKPKDKFHNLVDFCLCAVQTGNVETLKWLMSKDFDFGWNEEDDPMDAAIRSKSTEMIQICSDLGTGGLEFSWHVEAIRETKCLDVYRKVHELGYDFKELQKWYDQRKPWEIKDSFEIIMFLRSVSVPWSEKVMTDILQHGTLDMIRTAHEDGCPWSSPGGYHACLSSEHSTVEKCMFLIENGCPLVYDLSFVGELQQKKDLELLELFAGKNSNFDDGLFKRIVECKDDIWLEGITFMLENGREIENFASIEEVFEICQNIKGIKYFHSLGLPWTEDNATNTALLSRIACFNDMDDVKWAYENGCKGGELVQFVKKEWAPSGIRERREWKANRNFFEEKGLLSSIDIQEIGDAQLHSKYSSLTSTFFPSMFFRIDYISLKFLVDRGYAFRSDSEKDSIIKEALEKCFKHPNNYNLRKRLALLQQMGVREA